MMPSAYPQIGDFRVLIRDFDVKADENMCHVCLHTAFIRRFVCPCTCVCVCVCVCTCTCVYMTVGVAKGVGVSVYKGACVPACTHVCVV